MNKKNLKTLFLWLDFFTVNICLRLTVKILSLLRLTAKVFAVLLEKWRKDHLYWANFHHERFSGN